MFEKCMRWIFLAEGGYVNDPKDRGGETKYGISKRSYPHLDIKDLTEEGAANIYLKDYYNKCKCDKLPYDLSVAVFDCAVNQGYSIAIKLLQEALKKQHIIVEVDGIIGMKTIDAVNKSDYSKLFVSFMALRAKRYAQDYLVEYDYGQFKRLFDLTEFLK